VESNAGMYLGGVGNGVQVNSGWKSKGLTTDELFYHPHAPL